MNCKMSVCSECSLKGHSNHLLIQKENCLNLSKKFFSEIEKEIQNTFLIEEKRKDYIKLYEDKIDSIIKKLEEVKIKKINEINDLFIKTKQNINEVQENFYGTKKKI